MTGKLTLSAPLDECEIGEQKEIKLLVTVSKNDQSGLTATVDEVVDYEEEDSEDESESEPEEDDSEEKTPMNKLGEHLDKHAPAIAIIIGGKKK